MAKFTVEVAGRVVGSVERELPGTAAEIEEEVRRMHERTGRMVLEPAFQQIAEETPAPCSMCRRDGNARLCSPCTPSAGRGIVFGNGRDVRDRSRSREASVAMFATTRWSLVHAAGGLRSSVAREAIGALCETYWYPLYAYVRRQGCPSADAEDRIQAFFAFVLEGEVLAAADPLRGRFRAFLLKTFQNFLHAEHRREMAQKRGGGRIVQSLEAAQAEERYRLEPVDTETPERLFERQWALTLLQTTLEQVRTEYAARGQGTLYAALEAHLRQDQTQTPYAELAESLGLTEEAVKSAAHRLRKRYRELLRGAVADTLSDAGDVDDELRLLLQAVAGAR